MNGTLTTHIVPTDTSQQNTLTVPIMLDHCIDRFLQSQDVAEASRETYRRSLQQFTEWLRGTGRIFNLSSLSRDDILAYKKTISESGLSAYTISSYLTAVRKLFEWLEAEKIYPNIARGVKGAKKPRGFRKECLIPEQVREALDSIDTSTQDGLRDYALFNLMVRTGLRTIEIARATVGDIRQQSGEAVLWVQGKGRDTKDDFVLLLPETLRPIHQYLATRKITSDSDPLFASRSNRTCGAPLATRSIRRIIETNSGKTHSTITDCQRTLFGTLAPKSY
jgi:integrase/recombinase XerD